MGNKKKWTWHVSDLLILSLMVLCFILFLVTLVTEIKTRFVLFDLSLMLIVMVTVSVIPALGKLFYTWMIAEKEPDEEKQLALREKRTTAFVLGAFTLIVFFSVRLSFLYLLMQ